jgi:hypothetical protein
MNMTLLSWVVTFTWVSVPAIMAAEVFLPAEIAKHLADQGSLTYAALFTACMAVGLSIWLVRVILAQQEKAREDYRSGMSQVGRLAEAMERQPCQMVQSGLAEVVLREPRGDERRSLSSEVRDRKSGDSHA